MLVPLIDRLKWYRKFLIKSRNSFVMLFFILSELRTEWNLHYKSPAMYDWCLIIGLLTMQFALAYVIWTVSRSRSLQAHNIVCRPLTDEQRAILLYTRFIKYIQSEKTIVMPSKSMHELLPRIETAILEWLCRHTTSVPVRRFPFWLTTMTLSTRPKLLLAYDFSTRTNYFLLHVSRWLSKAWWLPCDCIEILYSLYYNIQINSDIHSYLVLWLMWHVRYNRLL